MRLIRSCLSVRGQGLVEFAVALPIFVLLTLGIIEFGWLVYTNHTVNNATREGARYAMVHGERSGDVATISSVQPIVAERAGALSGSITTTAVDFSPDTEPGSQVTVATAYDYEPIIGMFVGVSPFTITSESTVIVQY